MPTAAMTFHRIRARLSGVLFAGATLAFAPPIQAQLPTLSGGTRVKLWLGPDQPKIQGTVFSQTADTLRVASDGAVRVVPISMIGGVEVGGGRSHSAGAARGAKVGAVIVGGVGVLLCTTAYESFDGETHPSDIVAIVGAAALTGAFYGAIIGGIIGAEGWTPVYPVRVAVLLNHPTSRATGLGLSFKF